MFGLEAVIRDGVPVGHLRRSDYGFFIDKTIGYGYIRNPDEGVVSRTVLYCALLCTVIETLLIDMHRIRNVQYGFINVLSFALIIVPSWYPGVKGCCWVRYTKAVYHVKSTPAIQFFVSILLCHVVESLSPCDLVHRHDSAPPPLSDKWWRDALLLLAPPAAPQQTGAVSLDDVLACSAAS